MALAFTDQRTNNKNKEEPKQEEVNQCNISLLEVVADGSACLL
jgi:hypothetical protein